MPYCRDGAARRAGQPDVLSGPMGQISGGGGSVFMLLLMCSGVGVGGGGGNMNASEATKNPRMHTVKKIQNQKRGQK